MSYTTKWSIENHVLSLRYFGEISEEEMRGGCTSLETFINDAAPPNFLLLDMRDVSAFASGFNLSSTQSGGCPLVMENIRWIILLLNPNYYYYSCRLTSYYFGVPFWVFKTPADVQSFILRNAPSTPLSPDTPL